MANQHSGEGSSNVPIDGPNSTVQLNIKTLESQIHSFQVDTNMLVSSFKEKIANEIGVPVGQQRLIFRGKVLKDDHPLSEYHVENGHTLHLVARQPAQSQGSSGPSAGEASGNSSHRVNDPNAAASHGRVGQISHSVVLGTFNVGDQGEGGVPDISRVIGAVLNSIGIGNQAAANVTGGRQSSNVSSNPGTSPPGNGAEGINGRTDGQSQAGNQAQLGPGFPFQAFSQALQIPLAAAAAVPVPTLNTPIPSSLTTISEFMNRMELALSQIGNHSNTTANSTTDIPRLDLPSNAQGLHTPEALSIVLRQAERLLSTHAVAALSHIAGRLEQELESSDPITRGQIQTESFRVGLAVHNLAALLLELGRTMLTLRMGQTPVESVVNSGPAVYISSLAPNPLMVQPSPLQTSSLFSGSAPPLNPMTLGSAGIGTGPRSVNIHIHAGGSLAPMVTALGTRAGNGDGPLGERTNGTGSADSGASRVFPARNIVASAVPPRSSDAAISNPIQPGSGVSVSQPPSNSGPLSSLLAEVNSQIRSLVGSVQGDNTVHSGGSLGPMVTALGTQTGNGDGPQGGRTNETGSADSGASRVSAVPPHSFDAAISNPIQPGSGVSVSQPPSYSGSLSSLLAEANTQIGSLVGSVRGDNTVHSGPAESNIHNTPIPSVSRDVETASRSTSTVAAVKGDGEAGSSLGQRSQDMRVVSGSKGDTIYSDKDSESSSSKEHDTNEDAKAVPLGLGFGGLERKRRVKQQKPLAQSGEGGTAGTFCNQSQQTRSNEQVRDSGPLGGQGDMASVMSQVLQSPALNGLLSGISEQTGVGSPDPLRNMLQQFTRSPQMRNVVNQIAQQVDSQEVDNMFAGMGGEGGGIDISRMFQQMMPIVSRALGAAGPNQPQPFSVAEPQSLPHYNQSHPSRYENNDQNLQNNVRSMAQTIESRDAPEDVFRAVVENSFQLAGGESSPDGLVDMLCSDEGLVNDYVDLLQSELHRRFQDESGKDK